MYCENYEDGTNELGSFLVNSNNTAGGKSSDTNGFDGCIMVNGDTTVAGVVPSVSAVPKNSTAASVPIAISRIPRRYPI